MESGHIPETEKRRSIAPAFFMTSCHLVHLAVDLDQIKLSD
jgi:hypothetical protein